MTSAIGVGAVEELVHAHSLTTAPRSRGVGAESQACAERGRTRSRDPRIGGREYREQVPSPLADRASTTEYAGDQHLSCGSFGAGDRGERRCMRSLSGSSVARRVNRATAAGDPRADAARCKGIRQGRRRQAEGKRQAEVGYRSPPAGDDVRPAGASGDDALHSKGGTPIARTRRTPSSRPGVRRDGATASNRAVQATRAAMVSRRTRRGHRSTRSAVQVGVDT